MRGGEAAERTPVDAPRRDVLLLCDYDPFQAQMVQDHIHALARCSRHRVHVLSFRGRLPRGLDLARFDAVIVHYSLFIYEERCLDTESRQRLAAFAGVKAVFLHDEYKHVDRTKAALRELGTNILFTCFAAEAARGVYGDLIAQGLQAVPVLTGYVSQALLDLPAGRPIAQRPIDIGYRGRLYPAWHGELGQDRVRIAERITADAPRFHLNVDLSIAERDRLYGRRWLAFLQSCKCVLGTESGASVVDFTGAIARAVEAHRQRDRSVSYEELRRRYFAEVEHRIPMAQISPRLFEAIAAGAALLLYEGGYSGRLRAGEHYFPLRRDHANFGDAAAFIRDSARVEAMAARARHDVLHAPENHERALVAVVDAALAARMQAPAVGGYDTADFVRRFGRYDAILRPAVVRRQAVALAARGYHAFARHLPGAVEGRVRAVLKRTLGRDNIQP